jgi:hypothetical protein
VALIDLEFCQDAYLLVVWEASLTSKELRLVVIFVEGIQMYLFDFVRLGFLTRPQLDLQKILEEAELQPHVATALNLT